jgi:hypothetical protein
MAIEWLYSRNGRQFGPVSDEQLKEMAASGYLLATDLVWRDGLSDWILASHLKGLNFSLKCPSPPPIPLNRETTAVSHSVAAHSLGISAVILGILALLICWIPLFGLLGLPLSGLGLLLGLIGLGVAVKRRGAGIGFPIAGSAISGLAIVIVLTITQLLSEAAASARARFTKASDPAGFRDDAAGQGKKPQAEQQILKIDKDDHTREFAIQGNRGLFHTRQISVDDNWSIRWTFTESDQQTDGISIWPVQGNAPVATFGARESKRILPHGISGSAVIPNGGRYIVQIIASNAWALNIDREKSGDVQGKAEYGPAEDRFMSAFLDAGRKNEPQKPMKIQGKKAEEAAVAQDTTEHATNAGPVQPKNPEDNASDAIPKEFREYFVRAEVAKANLTKSLELQVHDLDIAIRGEADPNAKAKLRLRLTEKKDALIDLKRTRLTPRMPPFPKVGEIGSLKSVIIRTVLNRSVIARFQDHPSYPDRVSIFLLTEIDTKSLKVGMSYDEPDLWEVVSIGAPDDDVRRRAPNAIVVRQVKKAEFARHMSAYEVSKKAEGRPTEEPDIIPAVPLAPEFRNYFQRADASRKVLLADLEKKIAELQASISDIHTLPVDKARQSQELILVRGRVGTLSSSKPTASLRNRPGIGELGVLESATIVAQASEQSVIASPRGGLGFRLSEVNTKSLKMRTGVKVDENEVWEVVSLDERPDGAIADIVKTDLLIVLRPVPKSKLDNQRKSYEVEIKAAEKPNDQ